MLYTRLLCHIHCSACLGWFECLVLWQILDTLIEEFWSLLDYRRSSRIAVRN